MNPYLKMRLMRDLMNMHKGTLAEKDLIMAAPSKDLQVWFAMLFGPDGTLFEDTVFEMKITFPSEYPIIPPFVNLATELFHPNVADDGNFYLDVLTKEYWKPEFDVLHVLRSIRNMIGRPDLKNALNYEAAFIYRSDYNDYVRRNQNISRP